MSEPMNEDEARMSSRVRTAMPQPDDVPQFDAVFAAAERRYRRRRGQRIRYGAAAAIGALVVTAFFVVDQEPPVQHGDYIEIAEIMNSTQWTAPSDVLLPRREFDVYTDLPDIPLSTDPAQGALL